MKTFDFQGLQIRYVQEGNGEPIVFLHNGGTSHAIWRDVMRALDGHERFALDLLGYGESSKPESGYELATYVEILAAFVDRLGPVRLVGNCMGSAISLAFAIERPSAVRALVLVNPLTDATFSAGQLGAMLALRKRLPAVSATVFGAMSHMSLGAWLGSYVVRMQLGAHGVERRVHETEDLCACYASDGQSRSLVRVLEDLPNYAALDRFEPGPGFPPICTIWGTQNRVLSPVAGKKLNETLRPAREEWLEGCGHLPMLEQPERVAAILRTFFQDNAPYLERAS